MTKEVVEKVVTTRTSTSSIESGTISVAIVRSNTQTTPSTITTEIQS